MAGSVGNNLKDFSIFNSKNHSKTFKNRQVYDQGRHLSVSESEMSNHSQLSQLQAATASSITTRLRANKGRDDLKHKQPSDWWWWCSRWRCTHECCCIMRSEPPRLLSLTLAYLFTRISNIFLAALEKKSYKKSRNYLQSHQSDFMCSWIKCGVV